MTAAKGWRVPLFYLFTALFWGTLYAYMSFFTPYAKSLGASDAMAGVIVGGYGLVQMVLRVPLGVLSDKLRRRKPFVILGIGAALLAALGMVFFPSPVGLLFFRGFAGVAAAAWVAITVLFSSYFSPEQAPRAMSLLQVCNTLGNTLASLLGAQLAQARGEFSAFWLAVGLGGIGLGISFFLKEKRPEATSGLTIKGLLKVGLTPMLLVVSFLGILLQMVNMGTSGSFTQQWAREIGFTTGQLGWMTLCAAIPNMLAAMLGGTLLLKKLTPRQVVMLGASLIAAAVLAIPFCRNVPMLLCAQAVQGLGLGLTMPMLLSLSLLSVDVEKRGAAMGFFQSIYALGMFVGPVLAGNIAGAFSSQALFFTMGGVAVLMAVLAGVLLRRRE